MICFAIKDNTTRIWLNSGQTNYINASRVNVSVSLILLQQLMATSNTCRGTRDVVHSLLLKLLWRAVLMISGTWCGRHRAKWLSCSAIFKKMERWAVNIWQHCLSVLSVGKIKILKESCYRYWPRSVSDSVKFGTIAVKLVSEEQQEDGLTVRKLEINQEGDYINVEVS